MLKTVTCVVAICDECGRTYDEDGEGRLYDPNAQDLRDYILADDSEYRWSIDNHDRVTCCACRRQQFCLAFGHRWGTWQLCLCSGVRHPGTPGCWCGHQMRLCAHCGERDDQQIATPEAPAGGEAA